MARILWVVMVMILAAASSMGQSYEATMQTSISGGVLSVDLYLTTTTGTSAILGDGTFAISFNGSALTYLGKDGGSDGRWDDGNSASYSNLTSSNVGSNASLDITKSTSGTGLDIPGSATRIGRIQFTVVDPAALAGLSWNSMLTDVYDFGGESITPSITFLNPEDVPLPVTLTSFTGRVAQSGSAVLLEWATTSEVNNYGYTVQRKLDQEGMFADLANAFVAGNGTTIEAQKYSYTDASVPGAGKYEYRLKQQDLNGAIQYSQAVLVNVSLTAVAEVAPREFQLMQNYPNPFNPTTMVKFSVPATGQASVKIYNMMGQEVVTLFDGMAEAGRYYAVPFNAANLASGTYFYRLVTEKKTDVRRMMLVK